MQRGANACLCRTRSDYSCKLVRYSTFLRSDTVSLWSGLSSSFLRMSLSTWTIFPSLSRSVTLYRLRMLIVHSFLCKSLEQYSPSASHIRASVSNHLSPGYVRETRRLWERNFSVTYCTALNSHKVSWLSKARTPTSVSTIRLGSVSCLTTPLGYLN